MLAKIIEKRPWTIIVAWIIIVALLAQYAMQVSQVVETQTESFLPGDVESIKAENLYNQTISGNKTGKTMNGEYFVVVHGVKVSLETYKKLKPGYMEVKRTFSNNTFSWIDLLDDVESQIEKGLREGVNGSLMAVNGSVYVNTMYIELTGRLDNLSMLITGVDMAYSQVYQASVAMKDQTPLISSLIGTYYTASNELLPGVARTYFNIIRTEALLERLSDSYNSMNLTQQDIMTVVQHSNLTQYEIPPVTPELVGLVYQSTFQVGGPGNFSNSLAASLASNITWQYISMNMSMEEQASLQPIFQAVSELWVQTVANAPDHRSLIISSPDVFTGQLSLAQTLRTIVDQLKPSVLNIVTNALYNVVPDEAKPMLPLIEQEIAATNFDENMSSKVLFDVVKSMLVANGIPDNEYLDLLVSQIVDPAKEISKDIVVKIAMDLVLSNMPPMGMSSEELNRILLGVGTIVKSMDPLGNETLANKQEAMFAAATLILGGMNITATPNELMKLKTSSASAESEAKALLEIILSRKGGEQAVQTLEVLSSNGLLGAPQDLVLKKLPGVLAESIMDRANISLDEAVSILESAVRIYSGESSIDEEVANLTSTALEKAYPEIIDNIKGVLVEKNLEGFLVAYRPSSENDAVMELKALKDNLTSILSAAGYNTQLVLGGTGYMTHEMEEGAKKDIQRSDRISMILVLIILALVLESIAAVILPFIGIGFGLVTGLAIIFFLAKAGIVDVTTHSRTILYTTGLGLGIDYAAYVSKRFREAAALGLPSRRAAGEAFRRSWRPVITGAITASIGFGSMLVAHDFPFVTTIGTNVPIAILLVMIASITFIPSLLAYVGETRWFWWPRHPVDSNKNKKDPISKKIFTPLVEKPLIPLAIIVLLAIGSGIVMLSFQGSYDMSLNLPRNSESAKSLDMINTYYDPGILYPVYIILSDTSKADILKSNLEQLSCVSNVVIDEEYNGKIIHVYMSINPVSHDGVKCAEKIREVSHQVDRGSLVGGMSSIYLDLTDLINTEFYHKVYPVAITLMFLTLLVAYGGLATAVSAVASVVLAAYTGSALTVTIYEKVIGVDVLWYLPVIVFTAILGVGMDYNSFYIARAREECEAICGKEGVLNSMIKGTPIVIGLSVIMAGAYLGLASTQTPGLSEMGTALVFGVIFAGLNAAVLLTPPIIKLLGHKAWWPSKIREEEVR